MKKIIALATLLFSGLGQAAPVDGYKDLKFGMSIEQARETKLCESGWHTPYGDDWRKSINGYWICEHFRFSDGYVVARFLAVGGEVKNIQLVMPEKPKYPAELLLDVLKEKYGEPSIERKDLIEERIKSGTQKKRKKNETAFYENYSFADGTVSLRLFIYDGTSEPAEINYNSPDLSTFSDTEISKKQQKKTLLRDL